MIDFISKESEPSFLPVGPTARREDQVFDVGINKEGAMNIYRLVLIVALLLPLNVVFAGEADVVDVEVKRTGENIFNFSVTVRHNDIGWDHYANKWEVVAPDGTVMGTRILHHPHVNEQPFTRSLSGVKIPQSIKSVTIRAHDSVHDYGGKTVTMELPR